MPLNCISEARKYRAGVVCPLSGSGSVHSANTIYQTSTKTIFLSPTDIICDTCGPGDAEAKGELPTTETFLLN